MKKRFLSLVIAGAMLAATLSACAVQKPGTETGGSQAVTDGQQAEGESTAKTDEGSSASGYELALITDVGTIDDKSFNQGSWEGLEKYAKEHNITHKYYKPAEKYD